MRRAVILVTLTCILFAVAGVTVATENAFPPGPQSGDPTESTVLESTLAGRTAPEATVPEATVPEGVEKPVEGKEEATVVVREEPKGTSKADPVAGSYGGLRDDNRIEKVGRPTDKPGKPEHAQGGKARAAGEPPGKSRSATGRPERAGKKGFEGNPGKVTLCHKDRVTISVGAPAESAHLRHGDDLGVC
jgi:hypothetical protein